MKFKCPNCGSENLSIGSDNTAVCVKCKKQGEYVLRPLYRMPDDTTDGMANKRWV